MSGGDLLYILAFIILPTAVLVSCIWALILLRKGVLLPVRPPAAHDISQEHLHDQVATDQRRDPVEETGEHVIVAAPETAAPIRSREPVVAVDAAALTGGESSALVSRGAGVDEDVSVPSALPAATTAANDVPPSERTQEMAALPIDAVVNDDPPMQLPEPERDEATAAAMAAGVEDAALPVAAREVSAPDLLMVPLDDPLPAENNAAPPATNNVTVTANAPVAGEGDASPPAESSRRRPVRRMVKSVASNDPVPRPRPRVGQRRSERGQES